MIIRQPKEKVKRECGTCTECCRGWLIGEAHGHSFYPGQPCHFVGEGGCSIYQDRPENPCKVFECEWLRNKEIPEWMKPDKCKVLMTTRDWSYNGKPMGVYLDVYEAGQQMDSKVLAWLFAFYLNTQIPMRVQVAGSFRRYGSAEFLEVVV